MVGLLIYIFKIQWSSTVGHANNLKLNGVLFSDMKIIKFIGVLLSRSGVLFLLSGTGVLLSGIYRTFINI
jgi:hypothetical protein